MGTIPDGGSATKQLEESARCKNSWFGCELGKKAEPHPGEEGGWTARMRGRVPRGRSRAIDLGFGYPA